MRDLLERQINQSVFSCLCEVSTGKFSPHIHPSEARLVSADCNRKVRENIVTCKDTMIDKFLNEVNGLELNVNLSSRVGGLPRYIPIVDLNAAKTIALPESVSHIGITLIDLLKAGISRKAGRYHEGRVISYRESLFKNSRLKGKKIILFLSGEDTLLEWVWYNRENSRLFEIIGEMNFFAVSAFNFSVFGNECAFGQALNLKKSLYSCELLEKNGINVIPHIYSVNKYQEKRWIEWFVKNPSIELFTVNCQVQRSRNEVFYLVSFLKTILTKLPYLNVVLQGLPFQNIKVFGNLFTRIHFAEKKAGKYAIGHKSIIYDNSDEKEHIKQRKGEDAFSMEDMITNNIISRQKYLQNLEIKLRTV